MNLFLLMQRGVEIHTIHLYSLFAGLAHLKCFQATGIVNCFGQRLLFGLSDANLYFAYDMVVIPITQLNLTTPVTNEMTLQLRTDASLVILDTTSDVLYWTSLNDAENPCTQPITLTVHDGFVQITDAVGQIFWTFLADVPPDPLFVSAAVVATSP